MYFGCGIMCNLACIACYTCATQVIIFLMAAPSTGLWSERALPRKTDNNLEYQMEINVLYFRTFIYCFFNCIYLILLDNFFQLSERGNCFFLAVCQTSECKTRMCLYNSVQKLFTHFSQCF